MGINYQISIWLPPDYPKPGYKYPVIYLTDGEVFLGQIAPMILFLMIGGMVPECLIVGLGHHVSNLDEWAKARDIDYDPPENPEGEPGQKRADDFLSFLKKELIPFIETTYPAEPMDRCLAGFSTGGMFTLYALLHEPDLFLRYLIGSAVFDSMLPHFLAYEQQLAKERKSLPVHAFFSAGELEENIVPSLNVLIDTLKSRNYEGLRLETLIDEGESHFSTMSTAFSKGFKALYKSE
jgi:predicted alpha/beta superfamily hydrolase